MRKFIKFIAAACAAAIFTGSVSAVSFASGTGTKSVAIAAQEGTKSVKITTEETIPFDGVVIYAVYEGQTLSSVEAKIFPPRKKEKFNLIRIIQKQTPSFLCGAAFQK